MLSSTSSSSGSEAEIARARDNLSARLAAIVARRKTATANRFAKWFNDPVGFVEQELLGFLWSKQKAIAASVAANRRTAVRSCHDVGKTALAGRIAAWWVSTRPPGEVFLVTTAPTWVQVRNLLWREIRAVHSQAKLPGELNLTEWWFGDQLVGFGRKPDDTNPTGIQGIHARYVLVILDEACGVATSIWNAVDTLIANDDSRILVIGNPDDPITEFFNVCQPGSGWNTIGISAYESPGFTGEPVPKWLTPLLIGKTWVEERKKKWGELSPIFKSKVLGEFPDSAEDSLITLKELQSAIGRELPLDLDEPNELGVDVARYGTDATIVYHRLGNRAKRVGVLRQRDLMQTCGLVVRCIEATGAKKVKVDDIGLGGGVTDRLRELRSEGIIDALIVPINVGAKPTESATEDVREKRVVPTVDEDEAPKTKFWNLRAELNWSLAARFKDESISIDDNEDLHAQAGAMRYEVRSNGKILIESKDDMKKRGLPSPDDWDALVLAFAEVIAFDDSYGWVMTDQEREDVERKAAR
jgi:hypothetical protein